MLPAIRYYDTFFKDNAPPCTPLHAIESPTPYPNTQESPPLSTLKINFDAVFDLNEKLSTVAIIVRNHTKAIIDWRCKNNIRGSDPLTLENIACREAAILAWNLKLSSVIIEGDCKEFFNSLHGAERHSFNILQMDPMNSECCGKCLSFKSSQSGFICF